MWERSIDPDPDDDGNGKSPLAAWSMAAVFMGAVVCFSYFSDTAPPEPASVVASPAVIQSLPEAMAKACDDRASEPNSERRYRDSE